MPKFDYVTIEPTCGATYNRPGEYAIYGYGTYEDWSVLAGQEKRSFIGGGYTTVDEAREGVTAAITEGRIPKGTAVDVSESTGYRPVTLPDTPPYWFDPAAAGEEW